MATVACPGCGLPRVESEVGATPCPVCAAAPAFTVGAARATKPAEPDPTAGLPADASELYAPAPPSRAPAGGAHPAPRWVFGAVTFACGALVGVGAVLGVQALDRGKKGSGDSVEVAARPVADSPRTPAGPPKPQLPEVAPMPHEPKAKAVEPEPVVDPEPEPKQPPPPPGRVTTFDLGPDRVDSFSVPFPMKKGEHVVIKGKVKTLKVAILDGGATLDASGLDATTINVGGKIDAGSTLKLNAPNGVVHIMGKVDGKSTVEVNAPGGEVKFVYLSTPTKEGSKIDNGATVAVTARVVEFKGDINGADTKVNVTLTRNAWLKVASVSGKAKVEYKSQVAGWSPPDVIVGPVAPTATFRKAGEEREGAPE